LNLNNIERESALWKKIEQYLIERIDVSRKKNDGDLDQFETAKLRGQLLAFKQVLALGDAPPPIEADSNN